MLFSRRFKGSSHNLPSPDGRLVATLLSSSIAVRSVDSLQVLNTISLPPGLSGDVCAFLWSPASDRLLVAVPDQIHVLPALGGDFRAAIRNPVSVTSRNLFIHFGPTGSDLCLCSAFGLKFVIFDLTSGRSFEIASPKFYSPLSAQRGFSFRPHTHHLALLTRTQGKDLVSLHHPATRELQRSWHPDTVDAHSLDWSPDGKWLVVCDTPAQGHRVLFFTPDGHLFKAWLGPAYPIAAEKDFALGAGVKLARFSPDGKYLALADHSICISLLNMASVTETMRLQHPPVVTPSDTLQIWQEQAASGPQAQLTHTFVKGSQAVSPSPISASSSASKTSSSGEDLRSGAGLVTTDSSNTLLASRLDDFPTTVWIWDLRAAELRAVLMFHGHVSTLSWHPSIRELLAIRCEGDTYGSIVFVWDPLWDGPRTIDFDGYIEGRKAAAKGRFSWLSRVTQSSASALFTDSREAMIVSLAEANQDMPPWATNAGEDSTSISMPLSRDREDSPLELVPAEDDPEDYGHTCEDEADDGEGPEFNDTFRFKKFAMP